MERSENILEYNTCAKRMTLPEYGRGVQKMVDHLKEIPDREKRSRQACAVVRVMEILNPSIHSQENWEHTLWDHMFIIADYDLDIDSPYPMPERKTVTKGEMLLTVQKKPIKATHYGRNIESIIDLIAEKEDGEVKTAMILDLATYMRTQYLIWNKDTVEERVIFKDIERISGGRVTVPENLHLSELSRQTSYGRPGASNGSQGKNHGGRRQQRRGRR